jgi:hypothetical protein
MVGKGDVNLSYKEFTNPARLTSHQGNMFDHSMLGYHNMQGPPPSRGFNVKRLDEMNSMDRGSMETPTLNLTVDRTMMSHKSTKNDQGKRSITAANVSIYSAT